MENPASTLIKDYGFWRLKANQKIYHVQRYSNRHRDYDVAIPFLWNGQSIEKVKLDFNEFEFVNQTLRAR